MTATRLLAGVAFNVAAFGVLLFLPAPTWRWWRAWVLLGLVCAGAILSTVAVHRANRGLLAERMKPPLQRGQPLADKLIVMPFMAGFFAVITLIPIDRFRLRLLPRPGALISCIGLAVFVAGWWIMTGALCENAFALPVVKHQPDRHQRVIDSGFYGWVRHPMYAGGVLILVGMPLWLESYAALLLASVPAGLLVLRIVFEERFLSRELEGYDSYRHKVRYRLIPRLW